MSNAPARSQLGRSALLIHGLAWLAATAFVVLAWRDKPSTETEIITCLGVAIAAVIGFAGWSMLLAVRALRSAENAVWPGIVLALFLLESSAFFVLTSNGRIIHLPNTLGLPVLVPVFTFASMITVPISSWCTRRAENRNRTLESHEWDRRRRWKYGFICYGILTATLMAILLPVPAYIFVAFERAQDRILPSWHEYVLCETPTFVADLAAGLFTGSKSYSVNRVYCVMLDTGTVSKNRLIDELNSTNGWIQGEALRGLRRKYRMTGLEAALKIGDKCIATSSSRYAYVDGGAAEIVAESGSKEQILKYVAHAETASGSVDFLRVLLQNVMHFRAAEFTTSLIQAAERNNPSREHILHALAGGLDPDKSEALFLKWLDDVADPRVIEVINAAAYFGLERARVNVVLAAMRHKRPAPRLNAIACFAGTDYISSLDLPNQLPVVRQTFEMLDDSDLAVRRTATIALGLFSGADLTIANASIALLYESLPELQEREAVRKFAKKWLDEQSK